MVHKSVRRAEAAGRYNPTLPIRTAYSPRSRLKIPLLLQRQYNKLPASREALARQTEVPARYRRENTVRQVKTCSNVKNLETGFQKNNKCTLRG